MFSWKTKKVEKNFKKYLTKLNHCVIMYTRIIIYFSLGVFCAFFTRRVGKNSKTKEKSELSVSTALRGFMPLL